MTRLHDAGRLLDRAMTEAELLESVIAHAHAFGWLVHHCRPARTKDGRWQTPIQGDAGFPDLVFARHGEVIFAELKREGATLTVEQARWRRSITDSGNSGGHYIWRPSDLRSGAIEAALR